MRRLAPLLLIVLVSCRIEHAASGRPPGEPTAADSLASVEQDSALVAAVQATLRLHYQRYAARDWAAFRRTFWPGATLASHVGPAGGDGPRTVVLSADEFARRGSAPGRPSVFGERIVHSHVTGYGDVADAWVIAERRGGGRDSARTLRGIDAFHLVRDGAEWRIVSLTATAENPGRRLAPPRRRAARRGGTTSSAGATRSAP